MTESGRESRARGSCRFLPFLKISLISILALSIGLLIFRGVVLQGEFWGLQLEQSRPTSGDPTALKLLSEQSLRNFFSYDGIWLFPKNQCKCESTRQQRSYDLQDGYDQRDLPAVNARRQAEFAHFQRREGLPRPPPLLALPNLPFGYPVYGVEVMPLHTVLIPGLQFEGPDAPDYKVNLSASLGTLNTLANVSDNVVQGRGRKQLIISTSDRTLLNFILQHVTYTSTGYQHPKVDLVSLKWKSSVAKFPVSIRYPVMPRLYDPGPERNLRDLVTIATKTFLRPNKLMVLLRSIRDYYPDLTVIVADDSKKPLDIQDKHVEYYTMPFGKGWFAGRNLAISQVTTKYVLWVDDDFLFNNKTKIEVLVDVLENTQLDVVGGSVLGNVFQFKLFWEQTEQGGCLHRRPGFFQPLEGFPGCVVTSGVVNFFLAHTERLRRVGFDPRLKRVAHSEFFVDGLGSLLVGSCPEVIVAHQPRTPVVDPELAVLEKSYNKYRTNTKEEVHFKLALQYFKNHLQCAM